MSTIIDTHTHLYDISDVEVVLREAAAAGVSEIVALSIDYSSSIKHLEIVQKKDLPLRVHLALGIHPGNIVSEEMERCFSLFVDLLSTPARHYVNGTCVVAVGETGLDFSYKWVRQDEAKKNEQRAVFQRHLDLAKEFDRPIVIHARGAWRECLDMTLRSGVKKANFHWYSGPVDVLKDILDAGFVISVSPSLEYSPDTQKAAEYAPIDRILVETDTPTRGWSPQDVWRTLRALCAIKRIDEQSMLESVNANARSFFSLSSF